MDTTDHSLVLYADDDEANRRLMRRLLERHGARHEFISVGSGREAIDAARKEDPQLVILDLNLPDMSGEEVLTILRRSSDVPIIILSGETDEIVQRRLLGLGANEYVTKPIVATELFRVIDRLIMEQV